MNELLNGIPPNNDDINNRPPPIAPVLRRHNAVAVVDDLFPRNLNLDFRNAMPVLLDGDDHFENLNIQNGHAQAFNGAQLDSYFYGMFQFAKQEQRLRRHETLAWDNYRNRFYNTFLVSEKEKIMSDMREQLLQEYGRDYPKFHGYNVANNGLLGFGKKKSSRKAKKSARKAKKSAKKVKKSAKRAKKSAKKSI